MQALLNQAETFHRQGLFAQAEALYRQLLESDQANPLVHARLATLFQQIRRGTDAFKHIQLAINAIPEHPELLKLGVSIATPLSENEVAEKWLSLLAQQTPEDSSVQEQLAGVLISNHKEQRALELTKSIIKHSPDSANAYNLKGLALSRLGETEKGYKAFQKAIKLNPGQLAGIRNLLIYGKDKKEPLLDEVVPQLEQRLNKAKLPPLISMNIAYVVSMYYEKTKQHQKAFHYLKLGNDENRANYQYAHEQTIEQFTALKNSFNHELKAAFAGKGLEDSSAIFILGMPRSGTTLVEQVLASHSRVGAEGEILDLKTQMQLHADILDPQSPLDTKVNDCLNAAKSYLDSVRSRQQAEIFTDKMPYNFMLLGLIALVLPNAKIIHCTRDPIETCFSIYKQNFSGSPPYTNNLTELGLYYREYQCLMQHWKELFGDQIYELNYETMVRDSESEIDKLLSYCQLEKESQCFAFYKNTRAVRTASVNQVRQPIYKDSLKASAPYKKQLAPLIEALGLSENCAIP